MLPSTPIFPVTWFALHPVVAFAEADADAAAMVVVAEAELCWHPDPHQAAGNPDPLLGMVAVVPVMLPVMVLVMVPVVAMAIAQGEPESKLGGGRNRHPQEDDTEKDEFLHSSRGGANGVPRPEPHLWAVSSAFGPILSPLGDRISLHQVNWHQLNRWP